MATKTKTKKTEIGGTVPTNGAAESISFLEPYAVRVKIKGNSDMLFHRWNCESIDEKANAPKGSKIKKTDDLESYIYRDEDGYLALPGEYLRQAIIHAAKFRQDPRSPRKSAMDLFKASVTPLTILASLGVKDWDYIDRRRVLIQRAGINRSRPALRAGWECTVDLQINLPEYIQEDFLHEVLTLAGRVIGLADFRPTYGRFNVTSYERL